MKGDKSGFTANPRLAQAASQLELTPIADAGGVPLYRQVKRALIKLIESGRFAPADCLPSESAIASSLQVSIGTLRKAVDELVMENVLIRRQGKGTFVAMHNNTRFLFQFFQVEKRDQDLSQEHPYPAVECVSFEKARATAEEALALGISERDPVFRIGNRLKLSGLPVVYDRLAISALTFKGLTERQFVERSSTIYHLYQCEYGITVLRAQDRARAMSASHDVCRILGLRPATPVLEVHRIALTFGEKPVEYRISTINTEQHDYVSLLAKRI
jgi:GntR family transcriptional regulator